MTPFLYAIGAGVVMAAALQARVSLGQVAGVGLVIVGVGLIQVMRPA